MYMNRSNLPPQEQESYAVEQIDDSKTRESLRKDIGRFARWAGASALSAAAVLGVATNEDLRSTVECALGTSNACVDVSELVNDITGQ